MGVRLLLLFAILASSIGESTAWDSTEQQNALDLIKEAVAKGNIFLLPAFSMKAAARIENQGKFLDGTYFLLWNGPEQWREEINFPGYSETQVGSKGLVWLKRSTDEPRLRIFQLHSTLGYGSQGDSSIDVAPRADETVKKIRKRKLRGSQVQCVEIVGPMKHNREVCIADNSGTVVRQGVFYASDLAPIGSKLFPRILSWKQNGETRVEIRIEQFELTQKLASSDFDPPPGATSRPGCMNPESWRRVHSVAPIYPDQDRQSHVQGTVGLGVLIGADGVPRNVQVLSGSSPGLNRSAIEAVQSWRYAPATCNGIPVEVETSVEINFTLSP